MSDSERDLPDELWLLIFSHFSVIEELDDFDPDVAYHIGIEEEESSLSENRRMKWVLSAVSRRFRDLMRLFAMEIIRIRSLTALQDLADNIRLTDSTGLKPYISSATIRLDIIIPETNQDSSSSTAISTLPKFLQTKEPHLLNDALPRKIVDDLLTVFNACDALTSLICRFPWSWMGLKSKTFVETLTRFKSLRVLRLHCPIPIDLSVLLPKLTELRVWDLSMICPYLCDNNFKAITFPNVHTINGPLPVLCPALIDSDLPVFKRLICQHLPGRDVPNFLLFLSTHGRKVKILEMRCVITHAEDVFASCPNITILVIHYDYGELLSLRLRKLEILGLLGNTIPTYSTTQMILFLFATLEDGLERGRFPNLRKVRILDGDFVKYLRRSNMNMLKLYDRRFRSWRVRLEDVHGESIVVVSS